MIAKAGIILFLVIAMNCSSYYYVNDESLVEKINSMNTTWKAKISERFNGIKKYDFKFLLGFKEDTQSEEEKVYKTMRNSGALSITVGVVSIVAGVAAGVVIGGLTAELCKRVLVS